jgi:hypothetical protein
MAARTASVTGIWTDTATWGGAAAPVAGDTVTINTGITVTVVAATTANMGTDPTSATAAADLVLSGTAQLIINGQLNTRCTTDITGGGVITVNGGGKWNIDPSFQATTTEYRFRCGVSGTGKLVLNDNAEVSSPVGYSWYQDSGVVSNSGQLDINGTASLRAKMIRMQRSASSVGWTLGLNITSVGGKFESSHCDFTACDDISAASGLSTAAGGWTATWEWNTWTSSTGAQNLRLSGSSTVNRVVTQNTFDLDVNSSGGWGAVVAFTANENYFDNNFTIQGTGGYESLVDCWNVKRNGAGASPDGPGPFHPSSGATSVSNEVLWRDNAVANPHWLSVTGLNGPRTLSGGVYCYSGTEQDGDCSFYSSLDASLITVEKTVFCKNSDGGQGGVWFTGNQPVSTRGAVAFNHCAGVSSATLSTSTRAITVGETSDNGASRVSSLKSNLVVSGKDDPPDGLLFQMQSAQTTANPLTAANATHNWGFSTLCNTPAKFYQTVGAPAGSATQAAPPYTNDLTLDPDLINTGTGNMDTWAAWWGQRLINLGQSASATGSFANARTLMLAAHNGTYPTSITDTQMKLCVQWLRRRWLPRNASGRGLGHDSLTAGIGGWLPKLSAQTATAALGNVTTNCGDGTLYWIISTIATAPDWDHMLLAKDITGTTVSAGFSGNQAVSASGVQNITLSGATLTPATNYYFHVVHKGAGTEAALDDYLKTSETVTSAAFQAAASVPLFMHNTQMRSAA